MRSRSIAVLLFLLLLTCACTQSGSPTTSLQTPSPSPSTPSPTPDKITDHDGIFTVSQKKYDYNGKGKLITQQQLFELAQKYNFFMYQAHPFRSGERTGDPNFMHGAEAFNCHYHHDNFNAKAQEFCEKYNLVKMSGTDFHHPDQPIIAGAYIPDTISDEFALANFYKSGKAEIIVDEKESQLARQKYIQRQKESK